MKGLLSILGVTLIGGSSPVFTVSNNQTNNQNEITYERFYWNNNHDKEVISVDAPWNGPASNKTWFTFNLVSSKNYDFLRIENSDGFTFSWGNDRYGTWEFGTHSIALDSTSNAKITNDNFDNYLQLGIYDVEFHNFLAKCHATVNAGYAWYEEGGQYYFQFLVYQYLHPINSTSGGTNWVYLGTNLELL